MKEEVVQWTKEVNAREIMCMMFAQYSLFFRIVTEKEQIYVKGMNGELHIVERHEVDTVAQLKATEAVFRAILFGKEKLRDAVKRNRVETNVSFRQLLLIESLFYLARIKEPSAKNSEIS